MNDQQNQVVATVVAGLLLVVLFLCPWRIESTGELQWSPIYQEPMSYVRSYSDEHGSRGSSRIVSEEAHIAVDILALEVLAFVVAGGALFLALADSDDTEEDSDETDEPDSLLL